MNVDLPEPEGPMIATISPSVDVDRDAGERVHLGVPHRVDLHQVARDG